MGYCYLSLYKEVVAPDKSKTCVYLSPDVLYILLIFQIKTKGKLVKSTNTPFRLVETGQQSNCSNFSAHYILQAIYQLKNKQYSLY
jgi:hypothetical protein